MRRPALIVLDGDDTLWISEPLYDAARVAASEVVAAAGLDKDRWESLQRAIDLTNVQTMGLSASRFPTSCRQAYEELAADAGGPRADVAASVERAARSVFDAVAELKSGAIEVVTALARRAHVSLLTKGDPLVQKRRIRDSNLAQFFHTVRIVDHQKLPDDFADLASRAGVEPAEAWSVGNSLRSDVLPAMEAGFTGIWIDAYVWEHERHDASMVPEGVIELRSLFELQRLFEDAAPRMTT